ncbi:hypothetical protein H6P81_012575 [Aristolochia fimbriata]|uniref:Uncharacterized protein n=1 Tax=Aristolochia fimbriata TaxID=158543 RepID=A0AAV7EFH1_ARIFI|nr:hypothetical protein H6P81_012575 [Aristolochia fimbriata]
MELKWKFGKPWAYKQEILGKWQEAKERIIQILVIGEEKTFFKKGEREASPPENKIHTFRKQKRDSTRTKYMTIATAQAERVATQEEERFIELRGRERERVSQSPERGELEREPEKETGRRGQRSDGCSL